MAVQVVRPTDTPEIRWPVPKLPREDGAPREDTREPTQRTSRESRRGRLRWALAWLSLVFGAMTAWLWLARQDEQAAVRLAAMKELRELAAMREELEREEELRPVNLRLYARQAEAKQAGLRKTLSGWSGEAALGQAWATEEAALKEAQADLIWVELRLRQLDSMQGPWTAVMKANEAAMRPALDRLAEESGRRFRPRLARSLRAELDRRVKEASGGVVAPARFPEREVRAKAKPARMKKVKRAAERVSRAGRVRAGAKPRGKKAARARR